MGWKLFLYNDIYVLSVFPGYSGTPRSLRKNSTLCFNSWPFHWTERPNQQKIWLMTVRHSLPKSSAPPPVPPQYG